ncbi:MAG: endonuclease/exonuclease/phosphatase family protein [Pseudomonadota bacterium]
MTEFTIASFNAKNLIGAEREHYRFERYTEEEFAWKADWMADQLLSLGADVVGFQEIFEEAPLAGIIAEADSRGAALNAARVPDRSKRHHRRATFRQFEWQSYAEAELAFSPNANDGGPGARRPGLALLSRFGFVGPVKALQVLEPAVEIPLADLGGGENGVFRLSRLSRPIQKARVPVGGQVVTVFNCHLKSKLGAYPRGDGPAPEADLLTYDPLGRAMGALRAALRRMAEAWVLRRAVLAELDQGRPVIVLGDFNDNEHAVSTEIVTGERPFKNYAWMRRHDAERADQRYSDAEAVAITERIEAVRLYPAETLFLRKSLRDMVFTTAFGGVFESIDQILLSRHFHPDFAGRIGEMTFFSVLNDHLTDGAHPEAPYKTLASDHGQIMAHLRLGPG